jgi:hypothetical protein
MKKTGTRLQQTTSANAEAYPSRSRGQNRAARMAVAAALDRLLVRCSASQLMAGTRIKKVWAINHAATDRSLN